MGQQLCFGFSLFGSISPVNAVGRVGKEPRPLPAVRGRTAVPAPAVMAPGQDATGLYLHLLPRLWVMFSRGINRHSQPPVLLRAGAEGAGG